MSVSDFKERVERKRIGRNLPLDELEAGIGVKRGWLAGLRALPEEADVARLAEALNEMPGTLLPGRFDDGHDTENALTFGRIANGLRVSAEHGREVWRLAMAQTSYRGVLPDSYWAEKLAIQGSFL